MIMIDSFVFLAPIFLLGIVALLGFVGCGAIYGVSLPTQVETDTIIPSSGPSAGGTAVKIVGSNLSIANQVTFDGVNATSFTVIGDAEIDAVTPAHAAGTASLVVTGESDGDTTSSDPLTFTYVAISFAQTASSAQNAENPPISVSLTNTAQGNLLIVAVSYVGPAGSVTLSDNLGSAFIHAGSGPWVRQSDIFYLPNISGGNITITAAGAGGPCSMCVSEYSGADPTSAAVYGFSTNFDSNGTAGIETIQGVAVSPAQAGDIVYAVVFAARATSLMAGADFVARPSTVTSLLVEDSIDAVAGAQTVATDDTSGGTFVPWVVLAVAVKA